IGPLADWLADQDAAFVVSPAAIKLARQALEVFSAHIAAVAPGQNANVAFDMYKSLLAPLEREAAQIGLGLRIQNDDTSRRASQIRFVRGGDGAKAARVPPLSNPPLSGLPMGPYFIAFDGAMSGSMGGAFSDFFGSWMKVALNSTGGKASDDDMKK